MENRIIYKIDRKLTDQEIGAISVVKQLQETGYETYFAGGAVRDELLGREVYDIDIATSAKPEEVKKLFPIHYERGKAFGVVAVREKKNGHEYEIATFRKDLGVADHRRPEKVEYTTAQKDAQRRDFTVNGLFYDPIKGEIIDFVDGLADIKRKIVCFIGEPKQRIDEDYLRMLRAVRFATKLDFIIEENSRKQIQKNAQNISKISAERLRDELGKILLSERRSEGVIELDKLNLLTELLPEIEQLKNVPQPPEFHAEGDVWNHTLLALKNINDLPKEKITEELVWTVLLHDIGKPETIGFRAVTGKTSITFFDHDMRSAEMAEKILKRLRFSHHFIHNLTWAIKQHMRIINAFRGMSDRKQQKLFCDPNIDLLLNLTCSDLSASLRPNSKPDMQMYEDAVKLQEKFEKLSSENEKNQVKKFTLITGNDIMKITKLPPSKEIGKIKTEIETAYLDGKINTKDEAIAMMEKYKL